MFGSENSENPKIAGSRRISGIGRSMVIPKDLQGFGDLASYWSLVSSTTRIQEVVAVYREGYNPLAL